MREWPAYRQRQGTVRPGRGAQRIPAIDKGEQAFKIMIAILAPPPDVQREVDLGIGGFGQHRGFRSSNPPLQGEGAGLVGGYPLDVRRNRERAPGNVL